MSQINNQIITQIMHLTQQKNHPNIIINLEKTKTIDTIGVALLIYTTKQAKISGKRIQLENIPKNIHKFIQENHIDSLFNHH